MSKWNKRIAKYAGQKVYCNEFDTDGLETDYYIINADGTLSFGNEIRSIDAKFCAPQKMEWWSNRKKHTFLIAAEKNAAKTGITAEKSVNQFSKEKEILTLEKQIDANYHWCKNGKSINIAANSIAAALQSAELLWSTPSWNLTLYKNGAAIC